MKLQLIYLTINIEPTAVGVINKITAKCEKFNEQNSPCNWININEYTKSIFVNSKLVFSYNDDKKLIDFFNELSKGKIVIFRHHEFSKNIEKIIKTNITISEHNTIEIYEWINIYKSYNLRDWIYLFRSFEIIKLVQKLYFYLFKAKRIYKMFSGYIGVTEEIRSFQERNYYGKKIPSVVITNGVKKRSCINFDTPIINDKRSDITFVFFAGDDYIWNNFKRLVDSILNLNYVKIVYFGTIKPENKIMHSNISYFKSYNSKDIQSLNHKNTIGIGTLGLFKKKLNEACPLKVRDYWSLGYPVILGYKDTDVDNHNSLSPYVLEFSNDETLLDINKIKEFIESLKKYNRTSIINCLDEISIESKTKEYIKFIQSII